MIVDDIDELFKYFANFCQCGDKFYISGIIGNGASFDKVSVIIKNNNHYPSDIEVSEDVKRIKKLEVITKKGFIDRTKYILSHWYNQTARMDIKALRKNELFVEDKRVRTWYNYNKTMLLLHVVTEKENIEVNLVFCSNFGEFWDEYCLNLQFDLLVTELRDSKGKVIYESKYNSKKEEIQQQIKIRLLSNVIENYIENFRSRFTGPIDKTEAIKFAINTIMTAEFISITEYSPFKPYIISLSNQKIYGYIVDYIGPEAKHFVCINEVDEVSIDGVKLLEPIKESHIIEKRFNNMENILEIIELAQDRAFAAHNINEHKKMLT